MCRSVVNFSFTISVSVRSRQRRKCVQRNCCVYGDWLKQFTPFTIQAIPQPNQTNATVTFNRQWLAQKISGNIYNLIEIRLSVRGIVTDNHSANAHAFSALKTIQFRMKFLYKALSKQ